MYNCNYKIRVFLMLKLFKNKQIDIIQVNVMPTGMEEAPKAALDIHCLQQRGGAALTQTINLIPPPRGDGSARALMA